jgi:predicted ATPase
LTQALENLGFRGLIRRRPGSRTPGNEEFSFKHALIREVAYATLPHAARRDRHATVADFLEETFESGGNAARLLAHHWREAGASEQAIPYLLIAADQASRGLAGAEALDLCNEALELIPNDDEDRRREVSLKQAVAYARFTHLQANWGQLRPQRGADPGAGSGEQRVSPGNPPA